MRAIDSKRRHALEEARRRSASSETLEMIRFGIAQQYLVFATEAHPAHSDLVAAAEQRARDLGFSSPPQVWGTWKGRLIRKLFGWKAASWIDYLTRFRHPTKP
jgi:hypothetical protein